MRLVKRELRGDDRKLGFNAFKDRGLWSLHFNLWSTSWTLQTPKPFVNSRFVFVIRRNLDSFNITYAFETNRVDYLRYFEFKDSPPYALLNYFNEACGDNALVLVVSNLVPIQVALDLLKSKIENYLDFSVGATPVICLENYSSQDVLGIDNFLQETSLGMIQLVSVPTVEQTDPWYKKPTIPSIANTF